MQKIDAVMQHGMERGREWNAAEDGMRQRMEYSRGWNTAGNELCVGDG